MNSLMWFAKALTWNGRCTAAWYAVRRLLIAPAPDSERCYMGAPVGPAVWCPRRSAGDGWCTVHAGETGA